MPNWVFRKLDARIHKVDGDDGEVQVEVAEVATYDLGLDRWLSWKGFPIVAAAEYTQKS